MRIVIIGGVAAGTSAAAKARRNNENAQIIIYDRDQYISYSSCGMPYFIGGEVENIKELIPRDPSFFQKKYQVEVKISHEVIAVDVQRKSLLVKDLITGEEKDDHYDQLILATGASAIQLPVDGSTLPHVFTLRNIGNMMKIVSYIEANKSKHAVIIGTGFVGLEVCENLMKIGIKVTLVEKKNQVTTGLDEDMAYYVEKHLEKNQVSIRKGVSVQKIDKDHVHLDTGDKIPADLVIVSIGVTPNIQLAKSMGLELGESHGIKVDRKMMTSCKDVYACGDCVEYFHLVTRKPVYRPMGSTANKSGRIAGDVVTGGSLEFRGILGTGIFRIFGKTVAVTGLSEYEARKEGYNVEICHNVKLNRPEYMAGEEMIIKGIADREEGRLLGVQIVGGDGVDKRIDVFATAITYGAKVEDLFHLDLAYAPPFSTTKDPVMYTGMILDNAINQGRKLITPEELCAHMEKGEKIQVIDARVEKQYQENHVEGAVNLPHSQIREEIERLDPDQLTVTYCNKGVTGNAVQNILQNHKFTKVYNLSGGHKNYQIAKQRRKEENHE